MPVVVGDFCARSGPITVAPLARPGETVTVGEDGWGSKTVLTRSVGEAIAAHNRAAAHCVEETGR